MATNRDLVPIHDFVLPRVPNSSLASWSRRDSLRYFLYYIKSKLCVLGEQGGQITALAMGRPVSSIAQGNEDRYAVDWNGHILWVEATISISGIARIWEEAIDILTRYSCRLTHVAWYRLKSGKPVIFPINRVCDLIEATA